MEATGKGIFLWSQKMAVQVLVVAGLTYLVAGAPCAGVAKLALVFLATGNSDALCKSNNHFQVIQSDL